MNWTPEEDARLIELRAQRVPYKDIAVIMCRSLNSLDTRIRYLRMSEAARVEKDERRNQGKRLTRSTSAPVEPSRIPAKVLDDRAARYSAPVTLTGLFFGDPPVGFSALDRREHV